MTILTISAAGRLSRDEAWERYMDIHRWPEWAPQLTRVEASSDRVGFGVTGRVFGPMGVPVAEFMIDGLDEDARRWSWVVRRWPLTLRFEHAVGKQGGGSSTSLRMEGPLPVLVAYAPVARFAMQRLVSKTPRPHVETQTPAIYVDPTDTDPDASWNDIATTDVPTGSGDVETGDPRHDNDRGASRHGK